MRLLLFLPILLSILSIGTAWRTFLRGRSKGGNLGEPVLTSETTSLPKEQWFSQYMDHFNPTDVRFWKQRYFINSDFYKPNGPIFLMIGGEGTANAKWMIEGQWIEYAKEFGAMCFYLEHRYYGKSHPTPDLSNENLIFLSSEIALADVAYFITTVNSEHKFSNDTKWIVFGGSYGGSLAAWMRVKYPHLVHGAVSTSGPLLAQVDFDEYYIVVTNALNGYSDKCVSVIQEANSQINTLLHDTVGQQQIQEQFKLCDPIDPGDTKRVDFSNLYETLASNFAGIVQYNKDNRQSSQTADITIETVCDILVNEKLGKPIDRLAYVSNMILNATKEECLDYRYDKMIRELRNITWASEQAEGGRQWMYQTCTEFGFFQTSTGQSNMFGNSFPVEFFVQQCVDIFGPEYNALKTAVARTNILYGALNLQVTNVVFVHGSMDPWHGLGIIQSSNPQAPAIYIKGTAHCANMYPPSERDVPQLKEARIQIKGLIEQWLQN